MAPNIRTPLLIQHSERDLRTTVGQAEALFTVLRSLKRPVRFMRVPDESHELTRGGAPFRRAENLVQVRDWFVHFLVRGERRLPRRRGTAPAAEPGDRPHRARAVARRDSPVAPYRPSRADVPPAAGQLRARVLPRSEPTSRRTRVAWRRGS